MGWVAAQTERIHIGSAITSLPVTKEHPVRIAERAAMLDHVTNNRFEFGTGRGAGSHELMTFSGTQPSQTKAMWDEVIREIPRMWNKKTTHLKGMVGQFQAPTTSFQNHMAKDIPLSGLHAETPKPLRKPVPSELVPLLSTLNQSTTSKAALKHTKKLQPHLPKSSDNSKTTMS